MALRYLTICLVAAFTLLLVTDDSSACGRRKRKTCYVETVRCGGEGPQPFDGGPTPFDLKYPIELNERVYAPLGGWSEPKVLPRPYEPLKTYYRVAWAPEESASIQCFVRWTDQYGRLREGWFTGSASFVSGPNGNPPTIYFTALDRPTFVWYGFESYSMPLS